MPHHASRQIVVVEKPLPLDATPRRFERVLTDLLHGRRVDRGPAERVVKLPNAGLVLIEREREK